MNKTTDFSTVFFPVEIRAIGYLLSSGEAGIEKGFALHPEPGDFKSMDQYNAVERRDTKSGQNQRIVFTASKGVAAVGFTRAEWNAIKYLSTGTVTGPIKRSLEYSAPFTLQNRETGYATVWARMVEILR